MAATYEQGKLGRGSGDSLAVAFDSDITGGNLIIVTDTQSNTYTKVVYHDASNRKCCIFYAYNVTGGSVTVTVNPAGGSGDITVTIHEWSGILNTSDPLDVYDAEMGASSTPETGSVATNYANELIFGVVGNWQSTTTISPGSSYTERLEEEDASTGMPIATESKDVTSTGSYTADWTFGISRQWACLIATFQESVGDVTVTPAAVSAIAGKVDPTIVLGSTSVTPTASNTIATKADPTVVLGSTSVTPTPGYKIASKVDPTLVHGSISITPTQIYAIASSIDPTVVEGGAVLVTPDAAYAIASKADPTVVHGSISITPTVSNTIASKADPTVVLGSVSVTPTPGYAIASKADPTVVLGSVSITPTPVYAIASKADPTVELGSISITPTPGYAIASKVDPAVLFGSIIVTTTPGYAIASKVNPSVIEGDVLYITPAAIHSIASSIDPTILVLNKILVAMTLATRSWSFTLYERRGFFIVQYMVFEDESGVDFEDGDDVAWGAARAGISLPSRSLSLTLFDHD